MPSEIFSISKKRSEEEEERRAGTHFLVGLGGNEQSRQQDSREKYKSGELREEEKRIGISHIERSDLPAITAVSPVSIPRSHFHSIRSFTHSFTPGPAAAYHFLEIFSARPHIKQKIHYPDPTLPPQRQSLEISKELSWDCRVLSSSPTLIHNLSPASIARRATLSL